MKINSLTKQKHALLIKTWSDKALKGTVVNRTLPSLHEGSLEITLTVPLTQGYNIRKVNCSCVYSAYILKSVFSSESSEFVNKNRCISIRLISEEDKSIYFDNFDNSHNSFLWPEYFIDFMWKMDPMSGCDIPLVFTLPPRDSTLQYKRCVHLWNKFPCNTILL